MNITRKILNSKTAQRARRFLVVKSGIYCKIKRLSPSVSEDLRLCKLLQHFEINKVIDIGANTGQFAESIIDFGYKGEIISFEPVKNAYEQVKARASKYKQWTVAERCAIGNMEGNIEINVAESTDFSSIKDIKSDFIKTEQVAQTISKEQVPIYPLDKLKDRYFNDKDRIFLKIDTQGYEKEVIEGAAQLMTKIKGIKLEMPLSKANAIYNNVDWDIHDYFELFKQYGMECVSIEGISANKQTGKMLEVDAIFFRV